MNSSKYLPVSDNENDTETDPRRCHLVPRILLCTVRPDGALCAGGEKKRTHTFAAQMLPYQQLADERKNELHGEMHRIYGVS
jgi:hypothetical protein